MITIKRIEPADYKKTSEMIKTTIKVCFKNLYAQPLIREFCNKYELDNFKEKTIHIEMFVAVEKDKIVGIN